jgi:hypothetical protein
VRETFEQRETVGEPLPLDVGAPATGIQLQPEKLDRPPVSSFKDLDMARGAVWNVVGNTVMASPAA